MSSASPSKRRARIVAASSALAFAVSLVSVPADAGTSRAATTIPSTMSDAGLFGTGMPDYDAVTRQSLALMAYVAAAKTPPAAAVSWLVSQQCDDGGFQAYRPNTTTPCVAPDSTANQGYGAGEDTNATGLAAAALKFLGKTDQAIRAHDWIVSHQSKVDGGFAYYPDGVSTSDANSTALSLIATNAFGEAPSTVVASGGTFSAADFLKSVQVLCAQPDSQGQPSATAPADQGAYAYANYGTGLAANPFATIQATFALTGHNLVDGPQEMPVASSAEQGLTCTGLVAEPFDSALIAAGYLTRQLDLNNDSIRVDGFGVADTTGWAALSLIATGVDPGPNIDPAIATVVSDAQAHPTNPGALALAVLALHARYGNGGGATSTDLTVANLLGKLTTTLAPYNQSAPKITGTAKVGRIVTCTAGTWQKSPRFTYVWYSGATRIGDKQSLALTPGLLAKSVRCTVTATNDFGHSSAASATVKVGVGTLANTELPTIVGTARVGRTLAAISGKWNPTPTSAKYVWKRGTTVVGTGITYTVKKADRGKQLTVVVTVSRAVSGRTAYVGTATSKSRTVR